MPGESYHWWPGRIRAAGCHATVRLCRILSCLIKALDLNLGCVVINCLSLCKIKD